jgi:hypothetical protein
MEQPSARGVLLDKIRELKDADVLLLGALSVEIVQLWTNDAGNQAIVLIGNRRLHYLERHPEMYAWEELLAATVLDPDEVQRNRHDSQVALFYKRLDEAHYLRVAVLMQPRKGVFKHSILSYRLARVSEVIEKSDRRVWIRK